MKLNTYTEALTLSLLAGDVCCPLINLACSNSCHLLITFANSLDPDQDQQVKLFDTLLVFLKEFLEKVNFEKNQQTTKKHSKLPSRQS